MKKIFALVLALAVLMSLAVPVLADEHTEHTITINETAPGHVFEAYLIFSGAVEAQAGNTVIADPEWGTGVDTTKKVSWNGTELTLLEALKSSVANPNYYALYAGANTAADVATVLAANSSTQHGVAFAKIVGKYLSSTHTDSKPYDASNVEVTSSTQTIANYKISPLIDGYYLVKEKDGNDVDPQTHTDYILQLVKDVTITPKDGEVVVTKKIIEGDDPVDACANNIGDRIEFHINGTLPSNYAEYLSFPYEFVDSMSAGLTLDESTIKLYTVNGDDKKEIPASFYTVLTGSEITAEVLANYDTATKGTPTLIIKFADLKALTADENYTVLNSTVIRAEYVATLNANAEIGNDGNPNKVYLKYNRSPYAGGQGETVEDVVYVFTFELDVTKYDGNGTDDTTDDTVLAGAKFVVARQRSGHNQYAVLDASGHVTGWTNWLTEADIAEYVKNHAEYGLLDAAGQAAKVAELKSTVGVATEIVSGTDGKFAVIGLDIDTYWLIETDAPTGYNTIDPIKFTVDATYPTVSEGVIKVSNLTITLEGKEPVAGDSDLGVVATDVYNNPGHSLPTTGGMGTTLFYIIGGLMVCAAVVLLITKKRMAAQF